MRSIRLVELELIIGVLMDGKNSFFDLCPLLNFSLISYALVDFFSTFASSFPGCLLVLRFE